MPGGPLTAACARHGLQSAGNALAHYLSLAGSGDASAPHSVATAVTGSIDLRAIIRAADYTPGATTDILTKTQSGGNNRCFAFYITTAGKLALDLSSTGLSYSTAQSSVALGLTDNVTDKWVRVTWDQPTGDTKFWTSDDGIPWTQLGTTLSIGLASICNSGSALVRIGSRDSGATNVFSGRIYRAQIYNGIAGTLVFDANFALQAAGAGSFVESSANAATVTINSPAAIV